MIMNPEFLSFSSIQRSELLITELQKLEGTYKLIPETSISIKNLRLIWPRWFISNVVLPPTDTFCFLGITTAPGSKFKEFQGREFAEAVSGGWGHLNSWVGPPFFGLLAVAAQFCWCVTPLEVVPVQVYFFARLYGKHSNSSSFWTLSSSYPNTCTYMQSLEDLRPIFSEVLEFSNLKSISSSSSFFLVILSSERNCQSFSPKGSQTAMGDQGLPIHLRSLWGGLFGSE